MKKLIFIISILGSTAVIIWTFYEFFATNKGVHYYTDDPRRLGIVGVVGLVGGVCALIYSLMSAKTKRNTKLYSLGVLASTLSAFSVYMIYSMISSPSMIKYFGVLPMLPILFVIGLASYCWYEFRVVRRKNNTEQSATANGYRRR